MPVIVGCTAVVHRTGHRFEIDYDAGTGLARRVRHSGGAQVLVDTDPALRRITALSVRDGDAGQTTTVARYEYSPAGDLVGVSNTSGRPLRYDYDDAGRLTQWVDRNGVVFRYRYDAYGRCVAQAGSGGVYANAAVYLDDEAADAPPDGAVAVFVETATELDGAAKGPSGVDERIDAVEALELMAALRDGGLAAAGIALPAADGAAPAADVYAGVPDALLADAVLGTVSVQLHRVDGDGRVWQEIDTAGAVTTRRWDASGRLLAEFAPGGAVTRIERDGRGAPVAVTAPDGTVTRVEYGSVWGVPTRVVDPAGLVTEISVDAAGNTTEVVEPSGAVTRYGYEFRESGAVPVTVTAPDGTVTTVTCDGAGRPVRVVDAAGRAEEFVYDVSGNVIEHRDAAGAVTVQEFSADGRLLRRRHSDGSVEEASYDAEGLLVAEVGAAGGRRVLEYGPMDAPVRMVDAAGAQLRIGYDTQMRVRQVINPDGLVWRFDYDGAGRVVAETDYNGARTEYGYDRAGRRVWRVNAVGERVVTEYDRAGRVVAEESPDGRCGFVYDGAGRLVEAVSPDAVVRYGYDRLTGAVVSESVGPVTVRWDAARDGAAAVRTVDTTGVDALLGGVWSTRFTAAAGDVVSALTSVDGAAAVDGLRFFYDAAGRESSRVVGARARVEQSFDVRGRLAGQFVYRHGDGGPGAGAAAGAAAGRRVVAGRSWSYRADGYVSSVVDVAAGRRGFGLDPVGRVTAVSEGPAPAGGARGAGARAGASGGGASDVVVESFGYSPAGVLAAAEGPVSRVSGVAVSPVAGPARVSAGRGVSSRGTCVTRVGRDRFVFDGAGRMVVRRRARVSRKPEVTRFVYGAGGQVRQVWAADGSRWVYGYDAFGRRVSKRHVSASGVVVSRVVFGWDGDELAAQVELPGGGAGGVGGAACAGDASAAGGGVSRSLVWVYHPVTGVPLEQHVRTASGGSAARPAGAGAGVVGPEGAEAGAGVGVADGAAGAAGDAGGGAAGGAGGWSQGRVDDEFFAIVAGLAAEPTELIDAATGVVAGRARRSVWGVPVWEGVSSPLGFAGQVYDGESGLLYNRFRFYDPVAASYTAPDPLGVGANLYSASGYVHNPVTWVDPLGLKEGCPEQFAAGPLQKALEAPTRVNPWAGASVSRLIREGEVMYRVYGGKSSKVGSWITPFKPTSAAAVREGLALSAENAATHVSRVALPGGIRMQVGTAGPAFNQPGGWAQIELLQRIPLSSFGKRVPLP